MSSTVVNALAVLGLIATLVFGVLSVVFYLRSKRFKQLRLTWVHTNLQTRAHPDVSISFKDKNIANLSRLLVVVWNSGSEALRVSDFGSGKYPTLTFKDGSQALSVATVARSSANSSLSVDDQDEHVITLKFDYLNPGDGWWLDVLYDTPQLDRIPILLDAELIGGLRHFWYHYVPQPSRSELATVAIAPAILAIVGAVGSALLFFAGKTLWLPIAIVALASAAFTIDGFRNVQKRRENGRLPRFASAFPERKLKAA